MCQQMLLQLINSLEIIINAMMQEVQIKCKQFTRFCEAYLSACQEILILEVTS